jgi:hypothetical protein
MVRNSKIHGTKMVRNSSPPFKFPAVHPSEGAPPPMPPPHPLPATVAQPPILLVPRRRALAVALALGFFSLGASLGAVRPPSASYFSSATQAGSRPIPARRRRRGGRGGNRGRRRHHLFGDAGRGTWRVVAGRGGRAMARRWCSVRYPF